MEKNIQKLYELMPSKAQIRKIENRIKEYEDLINDIDIWLNEFNQKILRLKQNIIDEKELINKLILNFNQSFINYAYFENFSYLNYYIKYFNNKYLDKYSKASTFFDKGKILFEYLNNEDKILHEDSTKIDIFDNCFLNDTNIFNNGVIIKMTDEYFFKYSNNDEKMQIVKYEVNNLKKIVETIKAETTFEYHIIKASVYDNLDNTYKIYACLNNKKRVAIFNFDLNNCKLEKSDTEIIKSGFGFGHFKKAIQLPNELVATSDDDNEIDIWIKDKENDDGYTHLNNIILDYDIADILSVNSEYFISSHCNEKKINYYDIESLSIKKSLDNIDCLSKQDSLLLFNVQYIIINCKKGFALIYIKTKELV